MTINQLYRYWLSLSLIDYRYSNHLPLLHSNRQAYISHFQQFERFLCLLAIYSYALPQN